MPIDYYRGRFKATICSREGEVMGLWIIPFIGVSIFALGILSLVVVEYQDQKSRRFDSFWNPR